MLRAPRRVHPIPAWRLKLTAVAVQLVLLLGVGAWTMSTDEVSALAAIILHVHPLVQVKTDRRDVGLIVRTPAARRHARRARAGRARDPRLLRRRRRPRAVRRSSRCARCTTNCCPKCPPARASCAGCARAARCSAQARALGLRHRFYFLEPSGGLTVGQMVLARTTGATPVKRRPAPECDQPAASARHARRRRRRRGGRRIGRIGARRGAHRRRARRAGLVERVAGVAHQLVLAHACSALAFHQGEQQRRACQHDGADDQHSQRRASNVPLSGVSVKRSPNSTGASATGIAV